MKTRYVFLLLFISTIGVTQNFSKKCNTNIYEIRTINPLDTNYMDLSFLDTLLLDNKVLMLGEKAHGEGTITLAKTRLIDYLINKLGYNIIVFESGFYDVCMMNKLLNNYSDSNKIFWAAFSSILYNTSEFSPLKTLLINKIKNGSVKICGIDNQLGAISYNTLVPTISDTLKTTGFLLDSSSITLINRYVWNRKGSTKGYFEKSSDSIVLYKAFDNMLLYAGKINNDTDNFIVQSIKNLKALLQQNINNYYTFPMFIKAGERDKQMADNLLWIIRHENSNAKIIVWTASMHIARNINTIRETTDTTFYKYYLPMGQIVYDSLGDKMYSIGFSGYSGYYKTPYMMKDSVKIKSKDNLSIESYFHNQKIKYGFVNFRNIKDNYFLNFIYSNPYGNSNVKAVWPNIHDGMFYIETIHPPKLIKK